MSAQRRKSSIRDGDGGGLDGGGTGDIRFFFKTSLMLLSYVYHFKLQCSAGDVDKGQSDPEKENLKGKLLGRMQHPSRSPESRLSILTSVPGFWMGRSYLSTSFISRNVKNQL